MGASTNLTEGMYLSIRKSELPNRYAIYHDGQIRHLSSQGEGAATAGQFDLLIAKYISKPQEKELKEINRHEWVDWDRWYIIDLLLSPRGDKSNKPKKPLPRLKIYKSMEEARAAQAKEKTGI